MKEDMKADKVWENVKDKVKRYSSEISIGYYTNSEITADMKHFMFRLARYKFAVKMMRYEEAVNVLELGCNEAWGALLLKQNIDLCSYTGIDFDNETIDWNKNNLPDSFVFVCDDFFSYGKKTDKKYDLVLALDVIEHIAPKKEDDFCQLLTGALSERGTAIIGTPHIKMMEYASEGSRAGHINMYDQKRLFQTCKRHFNNVYIFNMNDEIVHTGMDAMSCYIFAVCSNPIIK